MILQAERLQDEVDQLISDHEKLLNEYDENAEHGLILVRR